MSNCCCELGLLKDIGPIIEGLRVENDRMAATLAIMALIRFYNDHHANFLVGVKIVGNTITFTRNDGTTIDIELPIPPDEYVNGAHISNKKLVLERNIGLDIQVDLSSIIPEIDTSGFFAYCELNGNTIIFKNEDHSTILGSINIPDTFIYDGALLKDSADDSFYIQLEYNNEDMPFLTIPLNNLYSSIINKIPFIPGYYLSKLEQTSSRFNIEGTLYLGTTWDPKTQPPTFEYLYVYKVIAIDRYELVSLYKVPRDGYYYVLSTGTSTVRYNKAVSGVYDEKSKLVPSGVVGIIKLGDTNLEIDRYDRYFVYLTVDTNKTPSSITYQLIKNNDQALEFTIEGRDNLGNPATAANCLFYPSRFIENGNFLGRYNWNQNEDGFGELVEEFNDLIIQSGYRYLFEIKHEDSVNTVNILDDLTNSYINGDVKDGLKNTEIRSILLKNYLGKAKKVGSNYVTGEAWSELDTYDDSDYFLLNRYENWKHKESLEVIWSYIMTNYFNCTEPNGAVSAVCYSDDTGWYTTWSNLSILNTSHGIVINANTECRDGEVVNPGNGVLPEISDTELPCSSFTMIFDIHTSRVTTNSNTTVSIHGNIGLNVGGRKWEEEENSETPYRYFLFSKVNNSNVILDINSLLYKTTLKSCNFTIEKVINNTRTSENVTYANNDLDVTVTTLSNNTTPQQNTP